jgi:hypothetical protein
MLYKILVSALFVALVDGFKADQISRRAMLGKAMAGAVSLSPLVAFAKDLKQSSDAEVYSRAAESSLNTARVIQRAKEDKLVVGQGATCPELESIIAVDKQAIRFEQDKLEALDEYAKNTPEYSEQREIVLTVEKKIEEQVKKLDSIRKERKCGADDASIYSRANEGKLNSARVIERAQQGKLVSGAGTTCKQLDAIIAIDKDALAFEKDKLKELQRSNDPAARTQIKIVAEAEKAISAQIKKLEKRREVYVEEFFGLEGCDYDIK